MDPLFERRNISKKVHIESRHLQKNMQSSILAKLKIDYEGKCSSEGFINQNSITIVKYSVGRTNYIRGGIDYDVQFQADICFPHVGQRFKAPMKLKSKIGIHAETPPIKILLPRDLHLGDPEFDAIKENEEIEIEVIGSQFKQQDTEIIIVGKLVSRIKDDTIEKPLITMVDSVPVTQQQPLGESEENAKQVTIQPTVEPPKKKTRQLKRGGDVLSKNDELVAPI